MYLIQNINYLKFMHGALNFIDMQLEKDSEIQNKNEKNKWIYF